MFAGRKLAVTLAFTALIAVAFGVSCQGFFVQPTLTSLTINPVTPSVQLNSTTTLSAYAVNSNGQGNTLTSGVSWSSSDPTTAPITGNCLTQPCGNATVQGLSIGTSTITASSENVTNTTTLTVYIAVSSMTIAPTSQSLAEPTDFTTEPYVVTVQPGSVDISDTAVLTAYQGGTQSSDVTCTYYTTNPNGGNGGPGLYCTGDTTASGTYQLIATYTGTTITATATLNVN